VPTEKNKITIRQIFILFILSTFSPAIRLFTQICSDYGKIAGWTAPIISVIALFIIINVLNAFFKNNNEANLSDIFDISLGKIAGKTLLVLYLIWTILLYFLYVRYYAERLLSSIFPNTNIRFFIIIMLIMALFSARGKIETFARFSEFSILLFTFIFIVFFILLAPTVKLSNLLPITYYDAWPALKSSYPVVGIWGYITLLFFLGDNIKNKNEIKKSSKKAIWYLAIMTMLMMITVVGSLGYKNAERMPLPFFNATKLINFMQSFDRFEAVLLSAWVISDFIVITVFAKIIANIGKKLFNVSVIKYFGSPIILLGYAGSLYLATNRYELEIFSENVAILVNIAFCYLIPIIVLIIGKLRKKI